MKTFTPPDCFPASSEVELVGQAVAKPRDDLDMSTAMAWWRYTPFDISAPGEKLLAWNAHVEGIHVLTSAVLKNYTHLSS